jgi:hypothetical protein
MYKTKAIFAIYTLQTNDKKEPYLKSSGGSIVTDLSSSLSDDGNKQCLTAAS